MAMELITSKRELSFPENIISENWPDEQNKDTRTAMCSREHLRTGFEPVSESSSSKTDGNLKDYTRKINPTATGSWPSSTGQRIREILRTASFTDPENWWRTKENLFKKDNGSKDCSNQQQRKSNESKTLITFVLMSLKINHFKYFKKLKKIYNSI